MQSNLSVLAFILMLGGVAGQFYVAGAVFSRSPLAIAVQLVAVLLMIWARITFGRRSFHAAATPTAGGLVRTGPYRFIRHPIYTAIMLFVWPNAIVRHTPASIAFAAMVSTGAIIRMLCEEHLLLRQYPEYAGYARETSRMIPFVF